jgi:hypothetical protein
MIINLDREIQQLESDDATKAILRTIVAAINSQSDSKTQMRGDLVLKDSGVVLRCEDGFYYRLTLTLSSGVPAVKLTLVGKNPTGE